MKKIFKSLVLIAVAAMALTSCNKEIEPQQEQKVDGFYKYSFAIIEDGTKAEIGENNVEWVEGDQVGMIVGSYKGAADVDVTTTPKTVSFSSASPIVAGTSAYAYFPYDKDNDSADPDLVKIVVKGHQKGSSESAMPLAGIPFEVEENVTNGAIKFLNLGSVINFKFYTTDSNNQDEVISSIKFETIDGSAVAGIGYIDLTAVDPSSESSLELVMDSEVSSVTVEQEVEIANNKDNAYPISMVVLPGTFEGTLTVTTNAATYTKEIPQREFARSASRTFSINLANATREELQGAKFVKVTSDSYLTAGEYLIVYEAGSVAFNGALTNLDSSFNTFDIEFDTEGNIIASEAANAGYFELAEYNGGFSIKSASGSFITAKSTGKEMAFTQTKHLISFTTSGDVDIESQTSTKGHLAFNASSDQMRFRYYNSGQQAIQLYKKESGSSSETTWNFTGIEVTSAPTKTVYNEGEFFSRAGMVVSALYVDAADPTNTKSEILGDNDYTVTPAGPLTINDTEVTITYNNKTTTFAIIVNDVFVTLSWTFPSDGGTATTAALAAIPGVSVNSLGDYAETNAPYCIKLDATGDYIQIKTDSAIEEVSVGYKMIGGATTSTLNILESVDGETFTAVQNLAISGASGSIGVVTTTNEFASASRYVKIHFTKGSNIGIGSISIVKANNTPSFNVDSPISVAIAGGSVVASITRKHFNGAITVSVPQDCDWVEADDIAENENSFNISVSANTGDSRTVTLTLSAEGVTSQELVINQEGSEPGSEAKPYTVAQALEVANSLDDNATTSAVYITGTVSGVKTYFTTYKSITYYISADGTTTNELEVYSGKGLNGADFTDITNLAVGDQVVIKGQLMKYVSNSVTKPEVNASSQIVSITMATRYTVTVNSGSNGSVTASATSVGAQGRVTLTINPSSGYELDVLTVGGTDVTSEVSSNTFVFTMPATDVTVTATFKEQEGSDREVTLKYTGTTTGNFGTGNEAATVGLSATEWSVIADKGSASNNVGYNKDGDIRLYGHSSGAGNTLTVSSLNSATINYIVITYTSSSYNNGKVLVGNNEITVSDGTYQINSDSFTIANGNTSTTQVRIKSIVINYTPSN